MSTLGTRLDSTIDRLLDNPEYLVKQILLTDNTFYKMLLATHCGGYVKMKEIYPELFI